MLHRTWFYPKPTGDAGRDRNAQTLQFACFLWAFEMGLLAVLNIVQRQNRETPLLLFAVAGLLVAAVVNRYGRPTTAAWIVFLLMLLAVVLLVFEARDGLRSHAMLGFPAVLLICMMFQHRRSNIAIVTAVIAAVAVLGICERRGLTRAIPHVRSSTTYESILYIDLNLLIMAIIGGRIARDSHQNISDLRASIDRLSVANAELIQIRGDLLESEERLKSAQRLTHVGSWHWNLGTNEVLCSDECKSIFGQPDDYAPSLQGLLEIIVPRDKARVAGEIQRDIEERTGCSTEFQVVRPDGDLRTVTFTSKVFLDEDGSPGHIFGACQDVTDSRRTHEEALSRQKLETIGMLANGIAHDFNNLLGAVLGQAESALTELEAGSAPQDELRAIKEVALRGSEIVRQLMIYAGEDRETIGPVDLSRTVAQMAELMKVSVSKHALLMTELAQDLPPLQADAAQIRRIVMNLVTNASQAIGDRDGVIRVRTACVAAPQAAAFARDSAERDHLELEVSDNGCGMSRETQSKVFEPFFTTRSAGHGLGLAVVQGIVRNLGGTIHLKSEPGQGTTFRILMPCAAAAAEEMAGRLSSVGGLERGSLETTVLIVEDEDVLRNAVAKALRRIGAEVLEAANGSAALDVVLTMGRQIEVMLLDLTIPGPSSQEVLAAAAQARPDLKVILTSAYSEEMAAASMGSPIIRSFIRKPFPLVDLVQTIRNVLSS